MRVYKDKATGKWKVGTRGEAIYENKMEAQMASLDELTNRLKQIRKKLDNGYLEYGT